MARKQLGWAWLWLILLYAPLPAAASEASTPAGSSSSADSTANIDHNRDAGSSGQLVDYSRPRVAQFLTWARSAEAIKDPLKRCLSYPDPPGSHWTPASVRSYCHYKNQPLLDAKTIYKLLRSGEMAELDRRMQAAVLKAQQTGPNAASRLNLTYVRAFDDDVAGLHDLLNAWKQASPNSAFAYAASGALYAGMAAKAHGEAYIRDTPQAQLDRMAGLVSYAETDLYRAIQLDPQLTPAYISLIRVARINETRDYTDHFIEQALAIAPTDFSIYTYAMQARQPRWGGSVEAMQALAERAHAHMAQNPMLEVLQSYAAFDQADQCKCSVAQQAKAYATMFDRLATASHMADAGAIAADAGDDMQALVLFSEALRFAPADAYSRARRSMQLTRFGDPAWGLAEANLAIAQDKTDETGYQSRAAALEMMSDYSGAKTALGQAIALNAGNPWQKIELGNIYAYRTSEWAKAWSLAEQLIQQFPDKPYGWLLRAKIQADEPRAGLEQTLAEFSRRFGDDPAQRENLESIHTALIRQYKQRTSGSAKPDATAAPSR